MPNLTFNPASLQSAQNVLFRREKPDIAPALSAAYRKRMLDDPRYDSIASLNDAAATHIPNSGWLGAAAQIANAWVGKGEEKKLEADYLGQQQKASEAYNSILSGDDVDPTVRQLAQSGVPELEEFAVTADLKSRMEGRKRNVQIIDGPDGKYEIDLDRPDAQPRKVLDAKPEKPTGPIGEYEYAKKQYEEANPGQKFMSFTEFDTSRRRAGASNMTNNNIMPGPKKADEAFASGPYVDWLSGGYANVQKNIQVLDEAIGELNASKKGDLTGPVVGNIPEFARPIVAPESLDLEERVAQVVQGGMREVLGGQYTQKEADAYIARMYNPKLGKEANLKRLQSFRNSVMRAAQAKQAAAMYFQKNGTLEGYQGQMPTWDDFYAAIGEKRETEKKSRLKFNPETGDIE